MPTEAAIADASRRRSCHRVFRHLGNDDLTPMGRRADTGDDVDGQADVTDIGQRGPAAVDSDAHSDREIIRPAFPAERMLDGGGSLDGVCGALEDSEELIGAGINLAAICARHARPQHATDVIQYVAVLVTQ